jgi:hypothetical protein
MIYLQVDFKSWKGVNKVVPPRPGEFPRKKAGALIVGEVEYFFSFAGMHAHGKFLITDKMVDELRALMLRSEKDLGKLD